MVTDSQTAGIIREKSVIMKQPTTIDYVFVQEVDVSILILARYLIRSTSLSSHEKRGKDEQLNLHMYSDTTN